MDLYLCSQVPQPLLGGPDLYLCHKPHIFPLSMLAKALICMSYKENVEMLHLDLSKDSLACFDNITSSEAFPFSPKIKNAQQEEWIGQNK